MSRLAMTALAGLHLLVGCASIEAAAPTRAVAPIARSIDLALPTPPGYPERTSLLQTATGRRGEQSVAFQAALELSPEAVEVVILAPAGPRVMSLRWDGRGVRESRTALAPPGLEGASILADIFLSLWPIEAVRAALPAGLSASETSGVRRIEAKGRVLVEIREETDGTRTLRNDDFAYRLRIRTEAAENQSPP